MAELIRDLRADAVAGNLAQVRGEIDAACARAGRDPAGVEVLAAVKYVATEELGVLAQAGVTLVGENRAQALDEKVQAARDAGLEASPGTSSGTCRAARSDDPPHVRLIPPSRRTRCCANWARDRPDEVLVGSTSPERARAASPGRPGRVHRPLPGPREHAS